MSFRLNDLGIISFLYLSKRFLIKYPIETFAFFSSLSIIFTVPFSRFTLTLFLEEFYYFNVAVVFFVFILLKPWSPMLVS